jgi:hypothetical protein
VDWGIGWRNVPSLHSCSTYDHIVAGRGKLGSSKHSNSHQQEFGDCWGVESLDAVGWKILVQMPMALIETEADQDGT